MAYKTGSLINEIMWHTINNIKPYIGMGATEVLWSDRHAYEVVKINDDKHIVVRRMNAINKGGFGSNDWELKSDPDGNLVFLTRYKDGWFMKNGRYKGNKFSLGYSCEYYDWSF